MAKKSGGSTLMKWALIGVVGAAGYHFRDDLGLGHGDDAGVAQTTNCLQSLGACSIGRCAVVESECAVDEACRVLAIRGASSESQDLAHDLLLEVCLRAAPTETVVDWKNKLMFRAGKRSASFLRRWSRTCSLDTGTPVRMADPVGDWVETEWVHRAICALDEKDQCVVIKKYFDGMEDEAVAQQCGLPSAGAVRQRLSRAYKSLRSTMAQQ